MDVVHERCCGLDIHKQSVVASLVTPEGRETRRFGTMTRDLLGLADWLEEHGITHVAMESTGVYWKPIYNLFESHDFTLLVVNAHHLKAVPGRKTDVKDAEWIAQLLRHGLLQASHIPSRADREVRELVRYRKTLIRERSAEVNRIQKVLEGANIKLASVASNVLGKSGRAMLDAIIAGVTDAPALAGLALGRLQEKHAQLELALEGRVEAHQRWLLGAQLRHIDFLDGEIDRFSEEIGVRLQAVEEAVLRLATIPGVGQRTAEVLVADAAQGAPGTDMSRFPSAGHLASWAGMCPGNNESAGKRLSGKTRKGSPWLREALTEAARAAARTRRTYLSAQYHRLATRRGANRAAIAVGHTILVIVYHLLREGTIYQDLGSNYFDERDKQRVLRRAMGRIEQLGYTVTLAPTVA